MRTAASTTTNAEDDSIISMLSNLNTTTATTNQSNLLCPNHQTSTLVPINVVNPFQGASVVDGVIQIPQYQQIMIQIPTIDILKIQAQQQQQQQEQQQSELNAYTGAVSTNSPSVHQSDQECLSRTARYQHKLFQHLHTELPTDVVSWHCPGLKFFHHINVCFRNLLMD